MKPTRKRFVWVFVFFATLLIAAGFVRWSLPTTLWLATRPTFQFVPCPEDPRVLAEPGAEVMARAIVVALPAAVRAVETNLYRPFLSPPKIYVCASIKSFNAYGGQDRSGFVFARRLFISPKPTVTAERISALVAHELVHLHVQQRRNLLTRLFASPDPQWFTEGLAVHAASDRGVNLALATEREAWQAFAAGRHFVGTHPERLGQALNYRQSGMFIGHLHGIDAEKYRAFLFAAEDGQPVERALLAAYGEGFDVVWRKFVAEASKRTPENQTRN